jgi:glycosyltransferase involved in cell wall biosynthesis
VDDVAGLLGACDLAAHSATREGCPNAVLEAMAAGLAVVATDIEGIRDAVGAGGGGLLAPAGDAAALASRLIQAAGDSDLRRRMGDEGRRRAEREFSPRAMGDAMSAVIAECLG